MRDPEGAARHLSDVDAICVPGGFGVRGIEGKIGALTYARTNRIPTLGLCLGLQCMVIEYSRNVAGLEKADSTEFDPDSPEPVIATMAEQLAYVEGAGDLGGTMRLGLYPAALKPGSHRRARPTAPSGSRSGTGTATRSTTPTATQLEEAGLVFSGTSPDNNLVEFVELPRDEHPYYVATQAHPELRSRPTRPHPLFTGLVGAAIERQKELRFPIDETGLRREPDRRADYARPVVQRPGAASTRASVSAACSSSCGPRAARRRVVASGAGPVEPGRRRRWSASSAGPAERGEQSLGGERGGLVEEAVRPGDHQLVLDRPPEAAREVLARRAGRDRRGRARTAPRPLPWRPWGRAAETPDAQVRVGVGVALEQGLDRVLVVAAERGPPDQHPPRQVDVVGGGLVEQVEVLRRGRGPGERVNAAVRCSASSARSAATSATRASRRGISTGRAPLLGGLSARRSRARRRWGSARSPAATAGSRAGRPWTARP